MVVLHLGSTAISATAAEINLIDGGASTGTTAVADADGIITNDGGTMRLTTAATFKTYFQEGISTAYDDLTTGDAAVNIATSAGNITIDAQGNDTDIIFKGTDGGADKTFMTIDGSAGGDLFLTGGLIDLKNDGSAVSQIKFYCESSNAHAQTLIGAPHSESATNTLTLPSTGGNSYLVTAASTATLTNKTLTTPIIAEIDSGSTITLDATTDIILDADGGDVFFKDGGTTIATLSNTSSDFVITTGVQDKDFIVKGDDGGAAITALTLDMSAAGAATFNDKIIATELDISGNVDIDGTTNLDAVDIDGAVQLDATLTIGANDQGYDVILYGDTASANLTWDTSADDLIFNGAAGLIVPDGQLTLGSTAVTSTAAELNLIDGGTARGTTAVADADGLLHNDNGTMRMTSAATFKTYFQEGLSSNVPSSADGQALGSASAEWSDLFLADGGQILFGNDQDVTLTHNADKGLILKHTATADDKPVVLTLQTGETDLAANDVIGKIEWQAPDEGTGTDAILVSAAIQATAEADHAANSNKTKLEFMTGASEAAATKMTLNSSGQVGIGVVPSAGTSMLTLAAAGNGSIQPGIDFDDTNSGDGYRLYANAGNFYIRNYDDGQTDVQVTAGGDTTIARGDLIFGTSGKGIVLGATSNTAANTLDDYEEGTFTGTFKDSSGATMNWFMLLQLYQNWKLYAQLQFSNASWSDVQNGDLEQMTGLPFTAAATSKEYRYFRFLCSDTTRLRTTFQLFILMLHAVQFKSSR